MGRLRVGRSGRLAGVIAEVGGFLDIADKHVMLQVGDVDLVPVDDQSYAFITPFSEERARRPSGRRRSLVELRRLA